MLEIWLLMALGASVAYNLLQSIELNDAKASRDFWRENSIRENDSMRDMLHRYHELRTNSHRRDPKTGRLLPLGK